MCDRPLLYEMPRARRDREPLLLGGSQRPAPEHVARAFRWLRWSGP